MVLRITHIGGRQGSGRSWCLTADEAIKEIETGETLFWLKVAGQIVRIGVDQDKGRKWLRTHSDPARDDCLWQLPECPETNE